MKITINIKEDDLNNLISLLENSHDTDNKEWDKSIKQTKDKIIKSKENN